MAGRINYLRTILRGEALREFDKLAIQNAGKACAILKFIQEVLLVYSPPINNLSNQKRAMRCATRKHGDLPFNHFDARLTELNNYLPLFPGSITYKNIPPKELNKIILHAVPNGWENKSYL